ncbi:hypothetical protein HETIRDRAFT_114591 [Heterobasidion irregulare TC 32-1]|uniref:Uncharacterized protein n=1 Tax=Heterobasidion irregulare (strain TC 32-1) TaxID=747525 RepID=W4KP67_HETIT|nr:uncharacterized protein HETIRDRAFT_114591 [Heterobasidion irregulare TC 32-1]ETW87499.1 hypothetical protein HETIRDRAFT_114591 [Heterobasidion irregulare TC 32-1]
MRQVLDRLKVGEDDESTEMSPVLHQTKYGSMNLAEFTKHGLKGPDTGCSAKIEMYTNNIKWNLITINIRSHSKEGIIVFPNLSYLLPQQWNQVHYYTLLLRLAIKM